MNELMMINKNNSRVLLHTEDNTIIEAPFDWSIFRFFQVNADTYSITCNIAVNHKAKHVILLQPNEHDLNDKLSNDSYVIYEGIPLGRSLGCPMFDFHMFPSLERTKIMNDMNELRTSQNRPIIQHCALALSVLIENRRTGKVLLTRRAKHMRSFPCVWVTPGGGVDESDKSLFESAQREVREETGLHVQQSDLQLFCMWESVFPHRLDVSHPTYHHLILYYRAFVDVDENDVKMQVEEVDAFAWLDAAFVSLVLQKEQEGTFTAFEQILNETDNSVNIHERDWHISRLSDDDAIERVSEGTNYVLDQWCRLKQASPATTI
jgi:8-oxo-dGTP pyrophosphatase MutT (NUDIX family)